MTLKNFTSRTYLKGRHPSWKHDYIRNLNRRWNKSLRKIPCQKCGYSKHVELAHIRPISKFPTNTKLKTVNADKNNFVLCRNCHWEFDKGFLKLRYSSKDSVAQLD